MTGKELPQSKNFHTARDGDKLSLSFLLVYEVQGLLYLVPAGPQGRPALVKHKWDHGGYPPILLNYKYLHLQNFFSHFRS